MNLFNYWRAIRHQIIFPKQFELAVFFLNTFGDRKYCHELMRSVEKCEEDTIGKELWYFMQKNKIQFVPWYEKHDIKHVILGFNAYPPDEMRMQAFMFGNCGFPVLITFIYLSFVIWTPEMWHEIPTYYKLGKRAKILANLKLNEILHCDLELFRKSMNLQPLFDYRRTCLL